jgi:RimJ/RimL family protein N-acetyltransferase
VSGAIDIPRLTTRRLLLRAFATEDADRVRELAGDSRIADTTLNVPHPYEAGMAQHWIASLESLCAAGEQATFAVCLGDSGELIGAMSLRIDADLAQANLGYWVGHPYWNQGYGTEAASAVVGFGFTKLQLHRIHAAHLARNPASGRVMQKLGMQQEGVQREHTRKWDRYEDLVLYGLLKREWDARCS